MKTFEFVMRYIGSYMKQQEPNKVIVNNTNMALINDYVRDKISILRICELISENQYNIMKTYLIEYNKYPHSDTFYIVSNDLPQFLIIDSTNENIKLTEKEFYILIKESETKNVQQKNSLYCSPNNRHRSSN